MPAKKEDRTKRLYMGGKGHINLKYPLTERGEELGFVEMIIKGLPHYSFLPPPRIKKKKTLHVSFDLVNLHQVTLTKIKSSSIKIVSGLARGLCRDRDIMKLAESRPGIHIS